MAAFSCTLCPQPGLGLSLWEVGSLPLALAGVETEALHALGIASSIFLVIANHFIDVFIQQATVMVLKPCVRQCRGPEDQTGPWQAPSPSGEPGEAMPKGPCLSLLLPQQ